MLSLEHGWLLSHRLVEERRCLDRLSGRILGSGSGVLLAMPVPLPPFVWGLYV